MQPQRQARYALVLAAAGNGAAYPIIRLGVDQIPAPIFVLCRFLLAALVLMPFALHGLGDRHAQRGGLLLGSIEGSVGALVAINIGQMPASRCAFIMGLSVVMVPLWAARLGLGRLTPLDAGRAVLSLGGLYLLTGAHLGHLGWAEAGVLMAAVLWALNIVLVKRQTQRHKLSAPVLAFYQAACNVLVPLGLCLWLRPGLPTRPPGVGALAALGYCALGATVVNLLIGARFQKHTSATQAALRLALEPLFAALLAAAWLHDPLTWQTLGGGLMMFVATLLPELLVLLRRWHKGNAATPEGVS